MQKIFVTFMVTFFFAGLTACAAQQPYGSNAQYGYNTPYEQGYPRQSYGSGFQPQPYEFQGFVGDAIYVNAFTPRQTPDVDRLVGDDDANKYFMPLWEMAKSRQIPMVDVKITLYLVNNGELEEVYKGSTGEINRTKQLPTVDSSRIQQGTGLCVQLPNDVIAHQRWKKAAGLACVGGLYEFVQQGGGRTPNDAIAVVAIIPGNLKRR